MNSKMTVYDQHQKRIQDMPMRRHRCNGCGEIFHCASCTNAMVRALERPHRYGLGQVRNIPMYAKSCDPSQRLYVFCPECQAGGVKRRHE